MENQPITAPPALVGASYNIYRYTDSIYKIVHFRNPRVFVGSEKPRKDKPASSLDEKLDASISRAKRIILEYALCNSWEWFGTFTLDKTKYDRYNLAKFYKDFTQWIRDQRKKFKTPIRYILIPEMHQDGAWHMHGLLAGVPDLRTFSSLRVDGWNVPDRVVDGGYSCWLGFHRKFGFCSLGALRNPVACGFYVSKYVGKSLQDSGIKVGSHLYYANHGLARAQFHGDVYGESDFLDRFTVNHYEFVDTGFTKLQDNLDWSFGLDLMNFECLDIPSEIPEHVSDPELASVFQDCLGIQTLMEGFH